MVEEKKHLRPPIVAVLGHVDHGKTTLLDKIRNTNLAEREVGGITQGIGAWQVEVEGLPAGRQGGKKITFIDTPGHEAFELMRSRGVSVADLVVLVVAADDGVMPQTRESIEHIKKSKIPFLVAITKVDLPSSNPGRVREQLLQEGVEVEAGGGDVVCVEVSAKTGKGVKELLEMIHLVAEIAGISGSASAPLEAVVIETKLDSRRGSVVHVVVKKGTLRVGDIVESDGVVARVRNMFDDKGGQVREAVPGMPVELLGFSSLPCVGCPVQIVDGGVASLAQKSQGIQSVEQVDGFPVVLKVNVSGALEALVAVLSGRVGVVATGVGDVSKADVFLAQSVGAVIVGFNVKVPKEVKKLAEESGVNIYNYRVIYELVEEVDRWMSEKEAVESDVLGRAQILEEFPHNKKRIAGCRQAKGRLLKSDHLRLRRDGEVLGNVRAISLKKGKEEVDRVQEGDEFGILFEPQFDFQIHDVLESVSR